MRDDTWMDAPGRFVKGPSCAACGREMRWPAWVVEDRVTRVEWPCVCGQFVVLHYNPFAHSADARVQVEYLTAQDIRVSRP